MNAQQAIENSIATAKMIATSYLEDLTEEEMMHRPHAGCNHIKWQLGHLLGSDNQMINGCCPGSVPSLPEGFTDKYTKETAASDDPAQFHTKAEYLALNESQNKAILDALHKLSAEDLDKPAPESMQSYAPTVAAAFLMIGSHWLMHAGQWAVIRRQIGRQPLF